MAGFELSADFTIFNTAFVCTPCSEDGYTIDAVVFCDDCESYFCDDCRNQHGRFRRFRDHTVLGKGTFEERGRQPKKCVAPKAKCSVPDHFGALRTIYCETCHVDCCANCALVNHEKCKKQFIPGVAEGIFQSKEFHDLISCFQDMQNKFVEVKVSLSTEKHEMQLEQEHISDFITEFRKKVNEDLDELQRSTEQALREKYLKQGLRLSTEIQTAEDRLKEIEAYLNEIDKLKRSECELYVKFMSGKRLTVEFEKELDCLRRRRKRPPIKFALDRKLERMLEGLTNLGNISSQWEMKPVDTLFTD